jgi:tetratricopeptide (TPR) repeat protein
LLVREWSEVIAAYEEAARVAGNVLEPGLLGRIYRTLAIAYHESGRTGKAISSLQKALAIRRMTGDIPGIARAENNLGMLLVNLGRYDAAEPHLRAALTMCTDHEVTTVRSYVLLSLAEMELARSRYAQAEVFLQQARAHARKLEQPMQEAVTEELQGRLDDARGRVRARDRAFGRAIAMLDELGATQALVDCRITYAEILRAHGELDKAVEQALTGLRESREAHGLDRQGPLLLERLSSTEAG